MVRSWLRQKAAGFASGYKNIKQNALPALSLLGNIPQLRDLYDNYGGQRLGGMGALVDSVGNLADKYASGRLSNDDVDNVLDSGERAYKRLRMA